jgi:hypothetical protein
MTRYVGNLVELAKAGRILENAPKQLLPTASLDHQACEPFAYAASVGGP